MNSKERKNIAEQTLAISQKGILPNGYNFSQLQRFAESTTKLYRPEYLQNLLRPSSPSQANFSINITNEATQEASYRLVVKENVDELALLNFASARNAGGGFLNGARAQEEDICRCSGLYLCQLTQKDFYQVNRQQSSMLYTDHIIYSPDVPFFRVKVDDCLDRPYLASVITSPAPNAGQFLRRNPNGEDRLQRVLYQRVGYILSIAKEQSHKRLLLGAWGCGVFRNSPIQVAQAFAHWLNDAQFANAFEDVTFAIYCDRKSHIFESFQRIFETGR